jgi:archaellin
MLTYKTNDTALAGVSAMIIFIAFILVSSIAGGVIIETAGLLQQKASSTGEEATTKISNTLDIGTTVAIIESDVNPGSGDFNYSNSSGGALTPGVKITQVRLETLKSPGAGQIDMRDLVIRIIRDSGTATVKYNNSDTNNINNFVRASADPVSDRLANNTQGALNESKDGVNFSVKPLKDGDDSYPILTQTTDRYEIRINTTGPRDTAFEPIRPGDDVLFRVITPSGAISTKKLAIPVSLPQEDGASIEI